jgi:acyl-CoA synthetase (AMP-forming)/AMP-acid ligase II
LHKSLRPAEAEAGKVFDALEQARVDVAGSSNMAGVKANIESQLEGDIGRVDAEGFVELVGRAKDMIISGGFNIYPSDLEAELLKEAGVAEAAVVGVPSRAWGETPVGFVVLKDGSDCAAILAAVNARLGKTQRLSALHPIAEMPRSHIGKLLKTDLRESAERLGRAE